MWLAFLAATVLTWIPPTLNDDGSLLTDLASYDIWYGCEQSGLYDRVDTLLAPATTHTVTDIRGTCYFAAKAVNSQGVSSVYSDELVRTVSFELPGPVVDTTITWRESVMAVTFVNAGTVDISGGTQSPGLPSGWAEDDIFILHIEAEYEDENADGQGDFGGTLIGSVTSGGSIGPNDKTRNTLYWKRAGVSESAPVIDDPGNHGTSVITAWRGCITSGSPLSGTPVSTSSSVNTLSMSANGMTTSDDGAMVVVTLASGDDGVYSAEANSNLVSISEAVQANNGNGSDGMIGVYYGILTTAGVSGTTTATNSLSEEEAHWTIALKPPGGAPPSVVLGRHPIDGGMNPVQGGMQ